MAALEVMQRRKFRALVAQCAAHSPYYREIIAERRIDPARCDIADFPVLSKADVDACRLDLVPVPGLSEDRLRDAALFAGRSLGHVAISVRAVDAIEPDPATGKVRAVVTSLDAAAPLPVRPVATPEAAPVTQSSVAARAGAGARPWSVTGTQRPWHAARLPSRRRGAPTFR